MPAGRNGTGIAKHLLGGVAALLLVGIVGSFLMGMRAQRAQVGASVEQAVSIADKSLGLVFRPDDLSAPVSGSRVADLNARIDSVVLEPSSFDSVTLWSQDGRILYSTRGRIGSTLDAERQRIRAALRGEPQTESVAGTFSIMVPLALRSGVDVSTAVELTMPSEAIETAPGPWRTNALFLSVLLAVVGFALYRVSRGAATGTQVPGGGRAAAAAHITSSAGRPVVAPPSPGLREEAEARRKAEDRARAAEERLGVLQSQYRNTLEELQTAQRRMQEQAAAARPDPRIQEELARTEQRAREHEVRARELQARLRVLEEEHRELARLTPDPALVAMTNERLTEVTLERDGLQRERDNLQREREELKRAHDAVEAERDAARSERDEVAAQRGALESQLSAQADAASSEVAEDPELGRRVRLAETEVIGLRAELDGAQAHLAIARRELEALHELGQRTKELQEDLDGAHVDTLHAREAYESTRAELQSAQAELDDARTELRALRSEEQRAAMLEDELRAARAELDSAAASHRAELVEHETEFETKVRSAREEFQTQIASLETRHEDDLAARERRMASRLAAVETAAEAKVERFRSELADRDARYGGAEQVVAEAKEEAGRLGEELARTRQELDETAHRLLVETGSVRELTERVGFVQREAADATARADHLAEGLEDATQSNADLNRRLQELEARRALEIANVEGRADLDQLLRVTQERLAGQTERLIAAEDNVHRLERELATKLEQIDQVEGELRHVQMSDAMRQIRGEGHEALEAMPVPDVRGGASLADGPGPDGRPYEDRRATTPFMKELSHDARKSMTQILGITQILKHKKDAKEQAQLVRQLTAHARRLDHVVSDMADAERLVRGSVELTVRRTDLEALVHRVVEESGVGTDHEIRIAAERVVVALDQLRTEQILAGLLRASADRTPLKRPITVRLQNHHGGALLSVEDPEPSSDASLSPVVQRFAELQGGWARVESGTETGSAFRVFLPDGAKAQAEETVPGEHGSVDGPEAPATALAGAQDQDAPIVVAADADEDEGETADAWSPTGRQLLVQELHRLSETADD